MLTAIRYFEELEAPKLGGEDERVLRAALELVDDEEATDPGAAPG
jgi:hypothetical protein